MPILTVFFLDLDWRIPTGFLDLYPPDKIDIALHPTAQNGRPEISIHGPWRSLHEKRQWEGWGYTDPWIPMVPSTAREMRRYNRAAITFMDYIVGKLLHELDRTGLVKETLVVFHSDHGWQVLVLDCRWRSFQKHYILCANHVGLLVKMATGESFP